MGIVIWEFPRGNGVKSAFSHKMERFPGRPFRDNV